MGIWAASGGARVTEFFPDYCFSSSICVAIASEYSRIFARSDDVTAFLCNELPFPDFSYSDGYTGPHRFIWIAKLLSFNVLSSAYFARHSKSQLFLCTARVNVFLSSKSTNHSAILHAKSTNAI
jgi:hypothetical protein